MCLYKLHRPISYFWSFCAADFYTYILFIFGIFSPAAASAHTTCSFIFVERFISILYAFNMGICCFLCLSPYRNEPYTFHSFRWFCSFHSEILFIWKIKQCSERKDKHFSWEFRYFLCGLHMFVNCLLVYYAHAVYACSLWPHQ